MRPYPTNYTVPIAYRRLTLLIHWSMSHTDLLACTRCGMAALGVEVHGSLQIRMLSNPGTTGGVWLVTDRGIAGTANPHEIPGGLALMDVR